MSERALIIFIKNPILGQVKTRLASDVGDDRALRIYRSLLNHTRQVSQALSAERYLWYSTFIDANDEWSPQHFNKRLQHGNTLGDRMLMAFEEGCSHHDYVVIIGSDCPTLSPAMIDEAYDALKRFDVVIGPAMDGGYYLLGMRRLIPDLFADVAWSSDRVLTQTIGRIENAAFSYHLLEEQPDIDHASDWDAYGWPLDDVS